MLVLCTDQHRPYESPLVLYALLRGSVAPTTAHKQAGFRRPKPTSAVRQDARTPQHALHGLAPGAAGRLLGRLPLLLLLLLPLLPRPTALRTGALPLASPVPNRPRPSSRHGCRSTRCEGSTDVSGGRCLGVSLARLAQLGGGRGRPGRSGGSGTGAGACTCACGSWCRMPSPRRLSLRPCACNIAFVWHSTEE